MARVTTTRPFTILLTGPGAVAQPDAASRPSTASETWRRAATGRSPTAAPAHSERHVAMFLRRIGVALVGEHRQPGGEAGPRVAWTDHLVHVAQLGGDVGARKLVPVFGHI